MPIAIAAAVVGGATTLAGAAISASASNHASDAAQQASARNDALQQATFESDKALLQPSIDRGNAAADELQGFLGLGGDPAKAQAALNDYLGSTGYAFARQQGLDAVSQREAGSGLYDSGAAEKALDAYGTGLAQSYGQQYVGDLGAVADRGQSGVNALVGADAQNAAQQAASNTAAASTTANAALAGATDINKLIGNAIGAYGLIRGQSSFGAANVAANALRAGG